MGNTLIALYAGYTSCGAYGLGNGMPWGKLPGDLKKFKVTTRKASEGKQNALIVGSKTARTLGNLELGEKRILIEVSRRIQDRECGGGWGPSRYATNSYASALNLAKTLGVEKIFASGGEACWLAFAGIANEMHLTIVERECGNPLAVRLQRPLHELAKELGMHCVEYLPMRGVAGASDNFRFEHWARPSGINV